MNQDSKDKIVTISYDLIVNKGYSLNKAAVSLSISKSTLRRWIDVSTTLSAKQRAAVDAALLHNKTFRTSDADVIQQLEFMTSHTLSYDSTSFHDSLSEAVRNLQSGKNR